MTVTTWMCAIGWVAGWVVLGRPRSLPSRREVPYSYGQAPGSVTIVVPARDEESSIAGVLADVQADLRPGWELVVVDDHSSDRTREVAAGFADAEVLEAPPVPPGWGGKTWACHTGALVSRPERDEGPTAEAEHDVLVFLDADVRLEPGALERLVETRSRLGGLVSVQPWHDTRRPYEQMSALFNLIALMGTGAGSRRVATGAFGPVLVTSRADYTTAGGHAAVRGEVVEDLALAANYRSAGQPVHLYLGQGSVSFRMYPDGAGQLAEGWTKNIALGAGATRPARLLGIVAWIAGMGTAATAAFDAITGAVPLAFGLSLHLAYAAQLRVMFARVGRFGAVTALLYPLLLAVFLALFSRSLWRVHVRRSVRWRGRVLPVRPGGG